VNRFTCVFVGVIIGLLIAWGMYHYLPKPKPEVITKIIEVGPTGRPDLQIKTHTHLTGQLKVTPSPSPVTPNQDGNQPTKTQLENRAILALKTGFEFTTELNGTVKTVYLNSEGDRVGEGEHPLTAKLTTIVLADGLDFTLDYPDSLSIKIESTPPPEPQLVTRGYWSLIDGYFLADLEYRPQWAKVWRIQPFVMSRFDSCKWRDPVTPYVGIEYSL